MGESSDKYISPAKLSIAYQISRPNSPIIYDWAIAISDGIYEQLVEIDQGAYFTYASYIIWLLIHQNFEVFQNLTLVKYEGSLRSIDRWTEEVKSLIDYYGFVKKFLVLAMSLFASSILRLSKASKLYLPMPQGETGDWFFTMEGTIIKLYGFSEAPFLLPIHVIYWFFSMEYSRQIDHVDIKYEATTKMRLIYALPHKVHDLVLQSRGGGEKLKEKLLALKLKNNSQYWSYNMEGVFDARLRNQPNPSSFKAKSRSELKKWRNMDREDKLVPMSLITKDLLPPWLSFYEKKAGFDPKVD